jgi:hypothetical protein
MFQEYYYQVSHFYIVVYDRFCLVHGSRKRLKPVQKVFGGFTTGRIMIANGIEDRSFQLSFCFQFCILPTAA